MIKGVKANLYW